MIIDDKKFMRFLIAYVSIFAIAPETPKPKAKKIKKLLRDIKALSYLYLEKPKAEAGR